MTWNTEDTKRRLKDAATVEFAAHGPQGTTMDRIAARAGVNKERLYNYFGDKRRLFERVLADELERIAEAVPVELVHAEDIGEYAGRVFDYHAAHPHLVRLLLWEGLTHETGEIPAEAERLDHYRRKIDAFAHAQRAGAVDPDADPAQLLFLILAIADFWFAVPQLAQMLSGSRADDPDELARRRAAVVEAARRLGQLPASVVAGP
jgi:AcrR family transcriptional regulator